MRKWLVLCGVLCVAAPVLAETPDAAPFVDMRPQRILIGKGLEAVDSGQPRQAIDRYADRVIATYTAAYKDSPAKIYTARTKAEAARYAKMADGDKRPVRIIDSSWSDAYLIKAYALTDLGMIKEAEAALEAALAMAPLNAHYLAELGNVYQIQRQWEKSVGAYYESDDAVAVAPADAALNERMRAWHGQAIGLTRLGRYDDAAAIYQKCLNVDPDDTAARNELAYIAKQQAATK